MTEIIFGIFFIAAQNSGKSISWTIVASAHYHARLLINLKITSWQLSRIDPDQIYDTRLEHGVIGRFDTGYKSANVDLNNRIVLHSNAQRS